MSLIDAEFHASERWKRCLWRIRQGYSDSRHERKIDDDLSRYSPAVCSVPSGLDGQFEVVLSAEKDNSKQEGSVGLTGGDSGHA
jgi:hypothetical protein